MRSRRTFCWNCWRDWHLEFLKLAPWEQDQFMEAHPRVNPNDYERGKCPFCGARYEQDIDDWLDDLLFDEEELEYDYADWEEE